MSLKVFNLVVAARLDHVSFEIAVGVPPSRGKDDRIGWSAGSLKATLIKLADHAADDGSKVFPGVDRIARDTGRSRRTVQRTLAAATAMGVLQKVRPGGRGQTDTAEYRFNIEILEALGQHDIARALLLSKGATVTPFPSRKGATVSAKGATVSPEGCHGDTRTFTEPSREPSGARASPRAPQRLATPQGVQDRPLGAEVPVDEPKPAGADADRLAREAYEQSLAIKGCRPTHESNRARQHRQGLLDGSRGLLLGETALTIDGEAAVELRKEFPNIELKALANKAMPDVRKLKAPSYGDAIAVLKRHGQYMDDDRKRHAAKFNRNSIAARGVF